MYCTLITETDNSFYTPLHTYPRGQHQEKNYGEGYKVGNVSSHYTDKHILLDEKDESLGRHESNICARIWVFFGYKNTASFQI